MAFCVGALPVLAASVTGQFAPWPAAVGPVFLLVAATLPYGDDGQKTGVKQRIQLALGEAVWAAALLWSAGSGHWATLTVLVPLLIHFSLKQEDPGLSGRFFRQMERAEGTLRSSERRHQKEKGKLQDFVTLQALLDDFQDGALRSDSVKKLARQLLASAQSLDNEAHLAVVHAAEGKITPLAVGSGFLLESFGTLPRDPADGKRLRSPDGLRLIFPLNAEVLFLQKRHQPQADPLRDEILRHLLERAALILRIHQQQHELASVLDQRTRALQQLADSQTQLVQSGKLAAVGQMAAGVAHEINSPLGAIQLQAEMARIRLDKGDLDGVRRSLDTCESASNRAKAVIDNLLIFSRLSDGSKSLVSLADVVAQTLAMLDGHFQQAEVEVTVDLPELPPMLANPQDIQHVLTNIAVNAVDALRARPEGRRLRLAGRRLDAMVVLDLENNGPAILDEHLEKVFEPFFTTKEAGQGTGLGLSLSFQLVKSHLGTLSVSQRQGWVTFSVALPLGTSISESARGTP
jgi:signal transduction histidine kinase